MAKKPETYLVNMVLPASGMSAAPKSYRGALAARGFNRYQQIGSIGGCIASGTLVFDFNNGTLTRR